MTIAKAPYYESRFVRANDPDGARALWLRETLLLPTEGEPGADVWVMVFDPAGHHAVRQRYAVEDADFGDRPWRARIAATRLDDTTAAGTLPEARWDLAIRPDGADPVRVLTDRAYERRFPTAKTTVRHPRAHFDGRLEIAGDAGQRVGIADQRQRPADADHAGRGEEGGALAQAGQGVAVEDAVVAGQHLEHPVAPIALHQERDGRAAARRMLDQPADAEPGDDQQRQRREPCADQRGKAQRRVAEHRHQTLAAIEIEGFEPDPVAGDRLQRLIGRRVANRVEDADVPHRNAGQVDDAVVGVQRTLPRTGRRKRSAFTTVPPLPAVFDSRVSSVRQTCEKEARWPDVPPRPNA